jgi:hypothetical protein
LLSTYISLSTRIPRSQSSLNILRTIPSAVESYIARGEKKKKMRKKG